MRFKITLFSLKASLLLGWTRIGVVRIPFLQLASLHFDIPHFHQIHTMPCTGSQTPHGSEHCQYGAASPDILPSVLIPRPCQLLPSRLYYCHMRLRGALERQTRINLKTLGGDS